MNETKTPTSTLKSFIGGAFIALIAGSVGWFGTAYVTQQTTGGQKMWRWLRAELAGDARFEHSRERATVVCRLSEAVPAVAAEDTLLLDARGQDAHPFIHGDQLLVAVNDHDGGGTLHLDGYAPAELTWTQGTPDAPGTCEPAPVQLSAATSTVTVRAAIDAEDEDMPFTLVDVRGCGGAAVRADCPYGMAHCCMAER